MLQNPSITNENLAVYHKTNNTVCNSLKYSCDNLPENNSVSSVSLDQQLPRRNL